MSHKDHEFYWIKERIGKLEKLVDQHFQTMGEEVGALDTRVRKLEQRFADDSDVVKVLGELYSLVDKMEIEAFTNPLYITSTLKEKIAGIQKRYGIGK